MEARVLASLTAYTEACVAEIQEQVMAHLLTVDSAPFSALRHLTTHPMALLERAVTRLVTRGAARWVSKPRFIADWRLQVIDEQPLAKHARRATVGS
jgi:hypothetical protein